MLIWYFEWGGCNAWKNEAFINESSFKGSFNNAIVLCYLRSKQVWSKTKGFSLCYLRSKWNWSKQKDFPLSLIERVCVSLFCSASFISFFQENFGVSEPFTQRHSQSSFKTNTYTHFWSRFWHHTLSAQEQYINCFPNSIFYNSLILAFLQWQTEPRFSSEQPISCRCWSLPLCFVKRRMQFARNRKKQKPPQAEKQGNRHFGKHGTWLYSRSFSSDPVSLSLHVKLSSDLPLLIQSASVSTLNPPSIVLVRSATASTSNPLSIFLF